MSQQTLDILAEIRCRGIVGPTTVAGLIAYLHERLRIAERGAFEVLLECDCGNCDSTTAPMLALPPCSAECGRTMRVRAVLPLGQEPPAVALLETRQTA